MPWLKNSSSAASRSFVALVVRMLLVPSNIRGALLALLRTDSLDSAPAARRTRCPSRRSSQTLALLLPARQR
ncbi:hypothetical protein ACFPRL_20455 [Pseudoclavibacter helvolus]